MLLKNEPPVDEKKRDGLGAAEQISVRY